MNDNMLLMLTRLKIPQSRRNYIIREELFSKLDKLSEYNVILIKGSAASGKTTLITSFAKEKAISNLKWISLDESCNNVFVFWKYLIEAVGDQLGAVKQDLMSVYDSNFQKSNFEKLITLLINRLNNQEDMFIVLDDFYYINDGFLLNTLDFFIKNVSENIHLILLTRQEPLLYLGELTMEGRLLVIGEEDLKLPVEAGLRFLKDTLKLNLEQETLEFMNSIAEGWIGGLQLVAAVIGGKNETEIKALNLGNGLVGEYLTKEIYGFLEVEEKEFLVATSIVSYFNEEISIKLLDREVDFKKIMEGLVHKNILIICLDEKNGIYRYHNILKEYLKGKFKGLHKEIQVSHHLKAAEILEKIGDYQQCLDQLLQAERYTAAMKLILELPQSAASFACVDRIPYEFIIENADFAYQCFFYYYVDMEFEKCRKLYDVLEVTMSQNSTFLAFRFSNKIFEENFNLNEISVMSISEIESLPLNDTTKAFVLIKDASFLYVKGRYFEALDFLNKAINYSVSRSNIYILFFAFSIKSQILEEMGRLKECLIFYKEMDKLVTANKSFSMLKANFYIGITGIYLKQMDIKRAEDSLENAAKYISENALSIDRSYKYNLAEYKFIIGETAGALELVNELMTVESYINSVYISLLLKYVFRLNKFSGEIVEKFLDDYEGIEEAQRSLDSKLLYAYILFNKKKDQVAMELTDQILKYSRMNKMKLKLVQAALFKIDMIYDIRGKKREIINLFREALFYSCEDKILSAFYFEREVVSKVIKQYELDFYNDLSFAEKAHYKEMTNICKIETKSILSKREIDVLNEIAKGAANKEIAEHLYISMATVKSHIINIYSKLQVNNRVAAIEAAKKQNMIM